MNTMAETMRRNFSLLQILSKCFIQNGWSKQIYKNADLEKKRLTDYAWARTNNWRVPKNRMVHTLIGNKCVLIKNNAENIKLETFTEVKYMLLEN